MKKVTLIGWERTDLDREMYARSTAGGVCSAEFETSNAVKLAREFDSGERCDEKFPVEPGHGIIIEYADERTRLVTA